ncbi:MAG: hypothetical protein J7578_19165 [Chitinophagaceae bacterium]|nr:hypothetical protein [Chitinophagaceae bacterium]
MLYEKAGRSFIPLFTTAVKRGLTGTILVLLAVLSTRETRAQGLLFNSNDSLLLKRTAYQVFSNSPEFNDRFSIKFDLSIWDKKHFGYVLTVKDDAGKLYTLSYLYPGKDTGYLHLNIGNESNKIKILLTAAQLQQRQWMTIKLDFLLRSDSMYMWVNGRQYRAGGFGFTKSMKPGIFFGKFEALNDVPSMAIRDLSISGNTQEYHFPLNEWKGEAVHATSGKEMGHVDFPNWLINESYFWKERLQQRFEEVSGVCYVPDSSKLFMFSKRSMQVYDLAKDQLKEVYYRNELPVNMILAKNIYMAAGNSIYVYEANNVRKDDPTIAALNLSTLEWKVIGTAFVPEQRHHHNLLFDSVTNQFYLFGGYGSFSYFNTFFRYDKAVDRWAPTSFSGDTITPRFFSAAGNAGRPDEYFIFGGFGNASGQQVVGGRHTYDLYRVNLTDKTIKKLWDRKISDSNFVPANNLILSADQKYFYVICYPHHISHTGLQLYKFSIEDGSYEVVSSKVPVVSEKIESDINLFLDKNTGELYCVIQEFSDAQRSTVRVLSLAWPPVVPVADNAGSGPGWIKILLIPVLIMSCVLFIRFRKKRKQENGQAAGLPSGAEVQQAALPAEEGQDPGAIRKNAIYVLGPLAVFDKKGTDITHLFSPKIRQLFVLILLKTPKGGITSREISLALWPEKEVTKTKNIRGVNINHLRNALADLDGIKLVFLNDSYVFEMDDRLFCDYLALMNEAKNDTGKDITPLFTRGKLLEDLDEPTLDTLRQGYEDDIIPIIFERMNRLYQQQDNKSVHKLSESILHMDPFNEGAIQYQLAVLRRWKGAEAARKKYDAFVLNYEKSLGVAYAIPFDKVPLPETGLPPQ